MTTMSRILIASLGGLMLLAASAGAFAARDSLQLAKPLQRALGIVTTLAERAPRAVGWGLVAATALAAGPLEVAIVTDGGSRELVDVAFASNSPGTVVAWGVVGEDDQPLLRDRPLIGNGPTAYVCRGFVCDAPVTGVTELAAMVRARSAPE